MKLVVDHIKDTPLALQIDEAAELFPVLALLQHEQGVTFTSPIHGDVTAVREYDHLRVNGRLTTSLLLSCSRCLAEYDAPVDTSFTLLYRKDSHKMFSTDDEVELDEAELLTLSYTGDEIDLTHEIEEQIALEIPIKPLCSESCRGLCHQCGADLNIAPCSCRNEEVNFKFSALQGFKVNR
ncbi:MAG TPA: DUF177 domain-containing protein [Desulfuromonadales bacterium]|nr:DUF177 domain-containing protein [Desulfuromonadales bacterium]